MRVKKTDGQLLHLMEKPLAHFLERALRDDRHRAVEGERRRKRNHVQSREDQHDPQDLRADVRPVASLILFDHCDNVLHEDGGNGGSRRGEHDTQEHQRQHDRIKLKQHFQKSLRRSFF